MCRLLQWGHDFSTVEIGEIRERMAFAGIRASMGPRFFNRGNSGDALAAIAKIKALQWGHDFSTVEIRRNRPMQRRAFKRASMGPRFFNRGNRPIWSKVVIWNLCFNGATIFQPWKSAIPWLVVAPGPDNASMGPRFFNRGNIYTHTI